MKTDSTRQQILAVLAACEEKKAEAVTVLELDKASSAFADYFVICSGTNPRQIEAIADEGELRLEQMGRRPPRAEGYQRAEWVLLDYLDFVVRIFAPQALAFYDLERLCKSAKHLTPAELAAPRRAAAAPKKAAAPAAASSTASS